MHKLLLYTTNDQWQVVNLKEARDFSNDLLPHPDMFLDASLTCSDNGANRRDDDGAKRVFFGGERFLKEYQERLITELNSPLGLEVQLHVPEAVCPALSEPGLRALLRFMTGFYQSTEAAGRSLVSIIVDHIFLCIKDAEFQLELLMQSLFFSRASVSDGENTKNLSRITLGGLFLSQAISTFMEAERGSHLGFNGINFIPLRDANIVVGGIAVRLSEKDDVKTSKAGTMNFELKVNMP
ncbi:hypothetical protein Sjap_003348 [Stephania japonica]|uniref:Uncharacterized protein n=1 Tax=Stephania japonica TaxID=461633 RepID=A0AAP0KQ62_9MAGN